MPGGQAPFEIHSHAYLDCLYEFQHLAPKDQVKLLSSADWKEEEIPRNVPIHLECHKHNVNLHKPAEVNNWDCDARKYFGKCFSGLTGFGQSKGLEGWSCRPCNFDICVNCLKVQLFIQKVKERED